MASDALKQVRELRQLQFSNGEHSHSLMAVFCKPLLLGKRELVLPPPVEFVQFSPHFLLSVGKKKS